MGAERGSGRHRGASVICTLMFESRHPRIVNMFMVLAVATAGAVALWPAYGEAILKLKAPVIEEVSSIVLPQAPPNTQTRLSVDTKIGNTAPHEAPEIVAVVPAAIAANGCVLTFALSRASGAAVVGGNITYTSTIKNAGNGACVNASYSMYYSEDEKFVSAAPKPSVSNYYWRIGALAPGASFVTVITTTNMSGNVFSNEGCATADNGSDACAESLVSTVTSVPAPVATPASSPASAPAPASVPSSSSNGSFTPPQGKEFGVWVWDSPIVMSSAKADSVVASASANKMNALYITIDDYLTIATLPAGATKDAKVKAYYSALNRIIVNANGKGIAVDAVGGARDWAITTNRWKGYTLIDFVKSYNALYPDAKIRNFQYDVEPYLLSTYATNQAGVLTTFVGFIDESMNRMQSAGAGFTVVVPHFYDSTQKWTAQVTYNGKTAYTFTHLLNILDRKQGSGIIIMSYRNFYSGNNDGVKELSTPELAEASSGYRTKVLIAQETGNVEPPYVTFYGDSKANFLNAVSTIYSGFSGYAAFGGVSVHYIDPYLELR